MSNQAEYLEGRDIAVALLRERGSHDGHELGWSTAIEAKHREGKPQRNWVLPYLRRLMERPELAEGFCAVLSDYMAEYGGADPEVYERLSIREMLGQRPRPTRARHPA